MKKYVFIVLFLLVLSIIILFPRDFDNKNIKIDYEIIEEKTPNYVYFVKDDKVYGLDLILNSKSKYELIEEVFLYLSEKSNSVSEEYYTSLNFNTKLLSYSINQNNLFLEVSSDFFNTSKEDSKYALAQIYYTYKELGFNDIYITYNGKILDTFHDNILTNGINVLNTNLIDLSTSKNKSMVEVIFYYLNDTKCVMNYVVNENLDLIEFEIEKIIEFMGDECDINIILIDLKHNEDYIDLTLKIDEKDRLKIEKIIKENFTNIKINFIFN